ncbi:replicative DNA helicase [Capnocytophaga stomatis]|uniref:replicative DNA helicase n=1 Tax=Capnocytophaga stomatis TaxID=1848904 RepID=UPI00194F912A|nr:DnaB-like helicase C-terminal domain-containing protein [Capnocytophaga stomatis]GIJ92810.1 replicative DNA helicase [Capnocytophaga stomatis]
MNDNNTSIEVEKKVLGALIVEPALITQYCTMLNINLFSADENKLLYEIIDYCWNKSEVIDLAILEVEFRKRNIPKLIEYAILLASEVSTTAHIEFHIIILVQLSAKRDFIQKFTSLVNFAKLSDNDIFNIRDKAFEYFNDLFIDKFIENNKKTDTFPDLVAKVEKKFEAIQEGKLTGLESSLNIINKTMGGWQNSDLAIVAGRPGMGKTAFLVQQVIDMVRQNKSVGVFSLEMSAEQITGRIITNYTAIPNSSILRKGLKQEELFRYINLKDDLLKMKIYIDDTSAISIQNLKMKAKMMKLRHNIEILFVDYLQLITYNKAHNREQEISFISRELKSLAKDLDVPIIALSQLSRNVEQRADKRPLLSDLRDSGAIEQDADEVIFLFRPEYYGIETWGAEYNNENTSNEVEINIAKNRHGGILSERCKVNMAISKFFNT